MGLEEDDDDFSDFMSRVNDVTATIEGLKTGTIDAKALVEADEARLREERERQAKKERKAAEARLQAEEKRREAERMARLREEKKDELEVRRKDSPGCHALVGDDVAVRVPHDRRLPPEPAVRRL
eukprot:scaffold9250_cov105-Isochrysis_galbana.AAC.2